MLQRFIFLKDAPDFFYVDVAAFDGSNEKLMNDFFEVERHGTPVIHFDKQGIAVPKGHHSKCTPPEIKNRLHSGSGIINS